MSELFNKTGKEVIEGELVHNGDPIVYVVEFRLRETLHKRGILQKELAEMTGLRPSAISNICRGDLERVSLNHIARIANALNITDIREILTLVDVEDSDWINMSNSLGLDEDNDE